MDHCCFSCPFERKSLVWGGEAVSPLLKVFKTSLGKTWSNLVWPQSWPCFQQVRSDSSIARFQRQRVSESVKNICPFLIRLLKPLAGTWPHIKDLQHMTFIHCCFVSVCWPSVMLSSASLLPTGKCSCLGFSKSWHIRANQRLVGPVKIWFPDNQVQEVNFAWLVGFGWLSCSWNRFFILVLFFHVLF